MPKVTAGHHTYCKPTRPALEPSPLRFTAARPTGAPMTRAAVGSPKLPCYERRTMVSCVLRSIQRSSLFFSIFSYSLSLRREASSLAESSRLSKS